ncbi:hypothetical protein [Brucella anthropi]|uniref:hypothetical protein n=1 Tax=Brucella anthropi TaxID=529 RepID=UPI00124CEF63|nr:hypothetical protein [Brucella anthropi]KAB2731547.1 hypothetical protein F9K89_23360 [Brucella anthropi]
MRLPSKGKFEWNFNTLLQLGQIAVLILGGVTIWVNRSRDIEDLAKWKLSHEAYHKERLAEVREEKGKSDQRFQTIEADIRKLSSNQESMSYQIASNTQAIKSAADNSKEIQETLTTVRGDVRVVMEILQRLEAGQRRPLPR